jgi:photosystem II stability/assembly factor-like uncharacterized protein
MNTRNHRILLSIIFSLIVFSVQAQQLDMKLLEDMKPRNIGPAGMSGRITAIDVVTSNPQIIYAGSASGGLWKSESGGIGWQPVMDSVSILSIGAVAIDQSNPDVVWVGTGEGNPRNSVTGGYGLYRTLDAGKTWQSMGLENTRNIHRIIIDKTNSNIVYVGAIGSPWGEHPERGVFKTIDGGKTWKKTLYVNEKTGLADLVVDANNPNKLIAAMWEHRRKPWTFNSGGPGSGIYITVDGGDNWQKLTDKDGIPKGDLGRVGLAISPSNPKRVYALIEAKKNGFYRSDDSGYTWKKMNEDINTIGNRPFYYSDIAVDPVNENRVYSVYTFINVTEDAGKSFKQWAQSYGVTNGIHPDHHAFWIHPTDPNFIIEGNDGGLNITRDRGQNWRFVENIPVAQFYHINVDNEIPYNVYGGLQDNGSWIGPGYVFKSGGIRNSYWQEIMFGDGFDVVPDPDQPSRGFGMSQQGSLGHYDLKTGHTEFIKPTHPDPNMRVRFNWNAAIAMDPFDHKTLYFGSQFVHKSINKGNSWEIISPDLTTNDPEKQKQHESGGLTMDATGAENNTTILAIEPSPLEKGLLWVGTDDGQLQITRDSGKNWSNLTANLAGMPKGAWIPQIRASKFKAGEAYVVVNNYRNFDFKPYLFRTRDYGQTWQQLLNQPETFGYSLALVQDPEEPRLLFLGTEHGLYVSIDEGANWTKWTNGYPSVSTMDLAIQQREHDLIMGTFGRAVWVLDDIRPLRELAQKGSSILKSPIKVYAAPNAYLASNQQATGTRFAGDAMYIGENRTRGAMITYSAFRKKQEEKSEKTTETKGKKKKKGKKAVPADSEKEGVAKDKKAKNDTIYVSIYNEKDELIRSLTQKYKKNGVHRMHWYMSEKGVRRPSRREPGKNTREPRGVNVLPGTYKVVMKFDDQKDSTMVKVIFDPRLDVSRDILKAKYDFLKSLEKDNAVAGKAMAQLRQSNKTIEEILKELKDRKGDQYDSLKKSSKAVKDSIKSIIDELLGAKIKKQGIVRDPNPNIMQYYGNARRYMGSSLQMPGPTEERLLKQGQEKLAPWLEKVNAFYSNQWPKYQEHVNQTDLSPFKEVKTFNLN